MTNDYASSQGYTQYGVNTGSTAEFNPNLDQGAGDRAQNAATTNDVHNCLVAFKKIASSALEDPSINKIPYELSDPITNQLEERGYAKPVAD